MLIVRFARRQAHHYRRACIGADALALPGNRATKNFFEQNGFVARSIVMHRPLDP